MTDLTLHWSPGSCARVPMIALEEAGAPFDAKIVAFMAGEHRSPAYLALNPKGKVPTLVVDGRPLTENLAILTWLAGRFPDAALLPRSSDMVEQAQVIADLSFCSSTLHPIVTRLRLPSMFSDADPAGVWAKAAEMMTFNFALIDRRLADGWWFGDRWSVMDAYLYWIWFRVTGSKFGVAAYPHYARHARAMEQRPAVQRALSRERAGEEELANRGLTVAFVPRAPTDTDGNRG